MGDNMQMKRDKDLLFAHS